MADSESLKILACSIVSLGLLMGSSRYSVHVLSSLNLRSDSCADAARWAAAVTLLTGVYYLQYNIWCRCRRRRRGGRGTHMLEDPATQTAYTDVPQAPSVSESGSERVEQQMTAAHVYVYVYGWGLLLFASLYCMAGLHNSSSCWWALGMLTLCFDELIMRDSPRWFVIVIGTLMGGAITSLWWGSGGESARDGNFALVVLSTVLPVMSPFIFFSLRSSVRVVTRDIWRLCELALPFMLLISICVLTGSYMTNGNREEGSGDERRVMLNTTSMFIETASDFDFNHNSSYHISPIPEMDALPNAMPKQWENEVTHQFYLCFLLALTPVVAAWCIYGMVWSVVSGYVTEFIVSFVLVLSVKSSVFSEKPSDSVFAVASSGICFVFIFFVRRGV